MLLIFAKIARYKVIFLCHWTSMALSQELLLKLCGDASALQTSQLKMCTNVKPWTTAVFAVHGFLGFLLQLFLFSKQAFLCRFTVDCCLVPFISPSNSKEHEHCSFFFWTHVCWLSPLYFSTFHCLPIALLNWKSKPKMSEGINLDHIYFCLQLATIRIMLLDV